MRFSFFRNRVGGTAAVWLTALLLAVSANAYSAPKTVLVLGDSLSAEYGIARGTGWVALMEAKLKEQKIEAAVVNASISGETSSGGRARLPALLKQHRPDVVVVELGANDGLRGLPIAAAQANLREIITRAKAQHAKVLLVGIRMPPNYGRDYADKFFAMYQTLAKETGVALVPFMFEGMTDQATMFQPDRMHPTAQAHPIILGNILPKLLPLVTPKAGR